MIEQESTWYCFGAGMDNGHIIWLVKVPSLDNTAVVGQTHPPKNIRHSPSLNHATLDHAHHNTASRTAAVSMDGTMVQ